MQPIWISRETWSRRLARLRSHGLWALVTEAGRVRTSLEHLRPDPNVTDHAGIQQGRLYLQSLAVCAACGDDAKAAATAYHWIQAELQRPNHSDLGRAASAVAAVAASAACRDFWPHTEAMAIDKLLFDYGKAFNEIQNGNPDNPFNNWWGVTHSAAALCFLAALETIPEAEAEMNREAEKLASYLLNYGDAGHYYEGTGYGLYSFCQWAPFALAYSHRNGQAYAPFAHGCRNMGRLLCTLTVPTADNESRAEDDTAAKLGRRVFWNDDGGSFPDPHVASLLLPIGMENSKALHGCLNRICGLQGDRSILRLSESHGHALWSLMFHPLEETAPSYGEDMPKTQLDQKNGLVVFRNRYKDGDDCVFAVYAKAYHGGGHGQEDAGSFRFMGLGSSWAHAGGQAKPQAVYQNVPLLGGSERVKPAKKHPGTGKLLYYAPNETSGGSVSVDISQLYPVPRVRRHFALTYDPVPGVDALLGIWEEIINPDAPDTQWHFPLCFESHLQLDLLPDKRHFRLQCPTSSASMSGFYSPCDGFSFEEGQGPPSSRTFSSGKKVDYPGARYLKAGVRGGNLNLLTLLILHRKDLPDICFSGSGLETKAHLGKVLTLSLEASRWTPLPLRVTDENV